MLNEQAILDSLRHIMDPDLGRDIVSLGFVKDIRIQGGSVRFQLELTTPACPMKAHFKEACEAAVMALPGVEEVEVELTAQAPRQQPSVATLERVDTVVAVSSCKGGVGKSTVAAHLARAMAAQGLKVALFDADVYGPSVPTLFNLHRPAIEVRDNLMVPPECDGVKLMSLGFLLGDAPAVLRGPLVSNYIQQVIAQTAWGDLDYLLIDLPPGTGDIQLTLVQLVPMDGAIIVTTPQALSLVDVARGILMFEKVSVPVLGIVENMASFTCDVCGQIHHPFGQSRNTLQARFGLPTLAELPIAPHIAEPAHPDDDAAIPAFARAVQQAVCARRAERQTLPEISLGAQHVTIRWPDGAERSINNHILRCACPCAVCVDEHTGEALLDPTTVPPDIAAEDFTRLGNYAVAFAWNDGHTTGIYSWDLLRRLADGQI